MKPFMGEKGILSLIESMAQTIQADYDQAQNPPLMLGIRTGGVWIAEYLHQMMALPDPLGILDISLYRDDFSQKGINPKAKPSHIPFNMDHRHIILVDDVILTGRTIRAAMNEIFDYARPASVKLAVLVERDGREVPIQADYSGIHTVLQTQQKMKLTGPAPLELLIKSKTT